MKIALTGHTSGIGAAIHKLYPDSVCFSRRTGYDIGVPVMQTRIIDMSRDCDVFINNAYSGWAQVTLLYKMWELWKDQEKTIVCICSDAGDYNHNDAAPYSIHKRALEDACLQLQHSKKPCKVVCVKPGYVDTPRVKSIDAKKMDPDDFANYIKDLLEMKRTFWIPVVTLYPA